MMTLKDAREAYYEHSGKASDVLRQLGVAGIGVIWVFKAEVRGAMVIPSPLLFPALLLVGGLFLDLLQYVLASAIWGAYARRQEQSGVRPDAEIAAPPGLNWPALACYWGKVVLILAGYLLIGAYVIGKVRG
ncbi:MAG TPA: hypothetical protein VFJ16_29130 [Longimicrobium sp.]|nr:hypothetical protein [Longimicrobium sp.]